jgi:hypothetical protein
VSAAAEIPQSCRPSVVREATAVVQGARADHLAPVFGARDLDEISAPRVRAWHSDLLATGKTTTVAKAYRLLKAIRGTAVDDELRNPCRIKGAGKEQAEERGIATIEQVLHLPRTATVQP